LDNTEREGLVERKSQFVNWSLLIIIALIWGSSFILIKQGLKSFSPVQVGSLRIFISFLALIPFIFFIKLQQLETRDFKNLGLVALFGSGIPPFLFAFAQTKINSSVAGILNALVPLFTLLLGVFLFNTKINLLKILGVLIGLVGSVGLILFNSDGSFKGNYSYTLLIILAGVCYATGANLLKHKLEHLKPVTITTVCFFFIGPLSGVAIFSSDFISIMKTGKEAWIALGYLTLLGVIGTAYALFLFNMLIQRTNALFASMVTYLIPMVAVAWGLLDNELLGTIQLLGLGIILMGIYLSSK